MGLSGVLNVANSGLSVTQAGLDVVARNIANSDTDGYTKKDLRQETLYTSQGGRGVRAIDVTRDVNEFLQEQVRAQSSKLSGLEVRRDFLSRVDQLFGEPGSAGSLDSIINQLGQSLQDLVTSPDTYTTREGVVGDAQILAQQIRSLSDGIQDLRQLAEDQIADSVADANDALQQLVTINSELEAYGSGTPPADTLDQRDKFIARLSSIMEIQVSEAPNNTVVIRTAGGETLLEGNAVTLSFDHQGSVGPETLYSIDNAERKVGTIKLETASGFDLDLLATGALGNGQLGTLVDLRDNVLTEAQAQLDELAHGLALSFSDNVIEGTAATSGAQTGLEVDLSGIQPGNAIALTYTQNGTEHTVSFVRVDDASALPLDDTATANPDDQVFGINFSSGIAAAIADINTALTGTLGANLTVSNSSGNVLQILDDGAVGTTDVDALQARITATSTQDSGLGLPLFIDSGETGSQTYSASLNGGSQKLGFASRIGVNASVIANNELLVRYSTAPQTELGDQTRPLELAARLSETDFTFSSDSGIGQTNTPFEGSVASFAQRIISFQTGQADRAQRLYETQDVVTAALQDQFTGSISVDVDEELSKLISLQNAFAANARVIQTTSELMDILLQI